MISIAILSTQALQNIDVNSGKIHFIGLLSFILKQFLFFLQILFWFLQVSL